MSNKFLYKVVQNSVELGRLFLHQSDNASVDVTIVMPAFSSTHSFSLHRSIEADRNKHPFFIVQRVSYISVFVKRRQDNIVMNQV